MKRLLLYVILAGCCQQLNARAEAPLLHSKEGKAEKRKQSRPGMELDIAPRASRHYGQSSVSKSFGGAQDLLTVAEHPIHQRNSSRMLFHSTGLYAKNYLLHIYPSLHYW